MRRVAVITGGRGMLAADLVPALEAEGWEVHALSRQECDVTAAGQVRTVMERLRPSLVVNCAAYTRVDRAEREEPQAFAVNARGAGNVARAAAAVGSDLLHISTDAVFDGLLDRPYREDDPPSPLGAYARSKRAGEEEVAASGAFAWIARTCGLYGSGGGGRHFFAAILEKARRGEPLRVVDDQWASPTWTGELARQLVVLVAHRPPAGIYHATCRGETTWYGAAVALLEELGLEAEVEAISTAAYGAAAPRPRRPILAPARLQALGLYRMRHWREALREWLEGVRSVAGEVGS